MTGERPTGLLGSPRLRLRTGDPIADLYRYSAYAPGRPRFLDALLPPCTSVATGEAASGMAAGAAASGSPAEARGGNDFCQ